MIPPYHADVTLAILIFQIIAAVASVTLFCVNCCFKRSQKSTNQKANPTIHDECVTAIPLKQDDVIKTDRTQEETDVTQELSHMEANDNNPPPEISPYPFEIINKGYGIHRKKRPPWAPQVGESHRKRRTRRKTSKRQLGTTPTKVNDAESIRQPSNLPPETPRKPEITSKPIDDREKVPIAIKSLQKNSIEMAAVDPTQDSLASTQQSNLTGISDPAGSGSNRPVTPG